MVLSPSLSLSSASVGIDIEHHRHLALLARRHGLLGEAEAVDLVEIGPDRQRRHVVGRLARSWSAPTGWSRCSSTVTTSPILTSISVCSGSNFQGRPRRDIGVEADRDLARQRRARRRRGRDLGGAVEAGGAAEPVVERHRRVGRADHQHHDQAADRSDQRVAAETRPCSARGGLRSVIGARRSCVVMPSHRPH